MSHDTFSIVECLACKLRFTNPRPTKSELGKYYKSDQYISHSDKTTGLIGQLYTVVRQYTLSRKVAFINKLSKNRPGALLDIGCGTGLFLASAKQAGWNIAGVEPDGDARGVAEKHTGQQLWEGWENMPANNGYDVITMWHVLEHIPDLSHLLQTVHEHLSATGVFIVAVPNCKSDDADRYGANWAGYDVPRHLYHFTPEVLRAVADRAGFMVIDQKPMPFDSYYVSMLSTQYRDGKTNYLESLTSGFLSNLKARATGDYSSITYSLSKKP